MADICKICGLPKELCVCGAMAKDEAKIKIYPVKRSFGKFVTIIEGINEDANPRELSKKLKAKLACGGTLKEGNIELQGNHAERVKKILMDMGFSPDKIEVSAYDYSKKYNKA